MKRILIVAILAAGLGSISMRKTVTVTAPVNTAKILEIAGEG